MITTIRCFRFDTIREIFDALEKEGGEWANKTLKTLRRMSPTSLQVGVNTNQ
jgi:hypothetical protein